MVWVGDAPGHDPVCSAISGEAGDVTESSVTAELVAAGIKVIAVSVGTTGYLAGLDDDPAATSSDYGTSCTPGGTAGQGTRITTATGGQFFGDVRPGDVSNKILEGLKALDATVTAQTTCDTGLSVTLDPTSRTVPSGDAATFAETVTANLTTLWPPNHKFITITVSVPDADGDAVASTVTGVTQDEAINGLGDGDTAPDAAWVPGHADQVQLRAERSGTGDGRVYRIALKATDGTSQCTGGTVLVNVPHDQAKPAVDTTAVVVNSFGS